MDTLIKAVNFTLLKSKDFEKILSIEKNAFKNDAWGIENFLRELPNKSDLSFILYFQSKIAGYIIGSTYAFQGKKTCHLNRIAVCSKFQNLGFGKLLLNSFENSSSKLNIDIVTLEITSSEVIQQFYIKLGYSIVSETEEVINYLVSKNKTHCLKEFIEQSKKLLKKQL
jgi:ribosomal protein S18 acetylase RimI-like enzyme